MLFNKRKEHPLQKELGDEDLLYNLTFQFGTSTINVSTMFKKDYEIIQLIKDEDEKKRLIKEFIQPYKMRPAIEKLLQKKKEKQLPVKKQQNKQQPSSQLIINEPSLLVDKVSNDILEKLMEKLPQLQQPTQTQNTIQEPEPSKKNDIYINLDKHYEEFLEYRKQFDKIEGSSISSSNSSMKYLKYFSNEDVDYTFKFFKELQKKFLQIPKNFFKYKKYCEISFDELMKLKQKDDYDLLNNKTINGHILVYKQFFDYLLYEEIIETNPVSSLKALPEEQETVKEEYSKEDLDKIFDEKTAENWAKRFRRTDLKRETAHWNMCKVALYAGLRIEEVLSIKKENIKDNMIYIDLEDKKSKTHKRYIPIHKNLLPIIEYQMKHNRGKYLFFKGNVGNEVNNIGRIVNRRLDTLVPEKYKTFHGFRKCFSQELEMNTNAEEKSKKYLMGHSQNKDTTHKDYNRNKVNIEKLRNSINQITFRY